MSSYSIRVELHQASETDYTTLHKAMEATGFSRVILGGSGVWYHLPTAEYTCESVHGIHAVRTAASQEAARTGRSHAVFVTEVGTQGRSWIGLNVVQAANR